MQLNQKYELCVQCKGAFVKRVYAKYASLPLCKPCRENARLNGLSECVKLALAEAKKSVGAEV